MKTGIDLAFGRLVVASGVVNLPLLQLLLDVLDERPLQRDWRITP